MRASFTLGQALPAESPLARWVTAVSMVFNDLVLVHRLMIDRIDAGEGEAVYLFRLAAGHLSEAGDPGGVFGRGIDDWPDVQDFVAKLSPESRDILDRIKSTFAQRDVEGSLAMKLAGVRNRCFHYPHLHRGQSDGVRLELTRVMRRKKLDEVTLRQSGDTLGGMRAGFADELATALATDQVAGTEAQLKALVEQIRGMQTMMMQFGSDVLKVYFRGLPDGVLQVVFEAEDLVVTGRNPKRTAT
jgi:hypothetical protein